MMTIGMGKIIGATELHTYGMDMFGELLPKAAKFIMSKKNFLFGVAMVENAADETALIEVVPAEQMFEREPVLQAKAKELMAAHLLRRGRRADRRADRQEHQRRRHGPQHHRPQQSLHRMGSQAAGEEDRRARPDARDPRQRLRHGLRRRDHDAPVQGNGYRQDLRQHHRVSTYLDGGMIPMIMNTDEEAIRLAVKTVVRVKPQDCKIVRIRNTLELVDIQVSEPLHEAGARQSGRSSKSWASPRR